MGIEIGDTVQLNPKYAKWYLDHPEAFFCRYTAEEEADYEKSTLFHLAVCLGEPGIGEVVARGCDDKTWGVQWTCGPFTEFYFVEYPRNCWRIRG